MNSSDDAPQSPPNGPKPAPYWEAIGLVWELGYLIAIPAVLFGFGGAYLDKYLGTSPLFLLLGFAISLLSSGYAVYKRVKRFTR